jgi:hypothetical protein
VRLIWWSMGSRCLTRLYDSLGVIRARFPNGCLWSGVMEFRRQLIWRAGERHSVSGSPGSVCVPCRRMGGGTPAPGVLARGFQLS